MCSTYCTNTDRHEASRSLFATAEQLVTPLAMTAATYVAILFTFILVKDKVIRSKT